MDGRGGRREIESVRVREVMMTKELNEAIFNGNIAKELH